MKNSQNHWCNGDIVVIYTIAWKSQWISMFIWYKWMKNAHEMLMDFSQTAQHGIQWTTVYFACTLRKWTIFLWTCIKYGRGINSHRIYVSNECACFNLFFFANWKCWHFFLFSLFILNPMDSIIPVSINLISQICFIEHIDCCLFFSFQFTRYTSAVIRTQWPTWIR